MQQVIHQHARTRPGLAIGKTQAMPHDIGERTHERRMLLANHQPLHAPRAGDQLVLLGRKQRFEGLGEYRGGAAQHRDMEAGDQALSIIERAQGRNAALEADVQVEICTLGDVLLQHGQRQIVTGAQSEQLQPFVTRLGNHPREI